MLKLGVMFLVVAACTGCDVPKSEQPKNAPSSVSTSSFDSPPQFDEAAKVLQGCGRPVSDKIKPLTGGPQRFIRYRDSLYRFRKVGELWKLTDAIGPSVLRSGSSAAYDRGGAIEAFDCLSGLKSSHAVVPVIQNQRLESDGEFAALVKACGQPKTVLESPQNKRRLEEGRIRKAIYSNAEFWFLKGTPGTPSWIRVSTFRPGRDNTIDRKTWEHLLPCSSKVRFSMED